MGNAMPLRHRGRIHPDDAGAALAEPLLGGEAAAHAAPPPPRGLLHWLLAALRRLLAMLQRWLASLQSAWRRVGGRVAPLSPLQQERLAALQARIGVPYSPASEAHVAALRQLWAAGFPGEPFPPGIKSSRWKDMGWQGEDPATDFRGGGFLSLEALLHLAQKQPDTFTTLMHKRQGTRSDWEYPFAAGGVNLTFMLTELLDLRPPGHLPASPAGRAFLQQLLPASPAAFEEVFCLAFRLLDRVWLEQGATYMEFGAVLREVRRQLGTALATAESLDELQAALLQAPMNS